MTKPISKRRRPPAAPTAPQPDPRATPPHLVLLPALGSDAALRPALLPAQPRPVVRLYATVTEALAELRRLQDAQPGEAPQ